MSDSEVTRGDTERWLIPITNTIDANGDPIDPPTPTDLKGCTVWCTVKKSTDDLDDAAIYQHWIVVDVSGTVTSSSGMSLKDDDPTLGIVVQELTPAESSLLVPGEYTFDVQVKLADGTIKTPKLGGMETVVPDWTRAITSPTT